MPDSTDEDAGRPHYGLFLVAAAGALGFWVIEGSTKSHQMRYYPRMGDIEAIAYELYGEDTTRAGPRRR